MSTHGFVRFTEGPIDPVAVPDPAAVLQQALAWLLGSAEHWAIGVAVAALAARQMRACNLHWSWAGLAGASAVLLKGALGAWTQTVALASLLAGMRGRRWHREDVQAGGDLARLAANRRQPVDAVEAVFRAVSTRITACAPARMAGVRVRTACAGVSACLPACVLRRAGGLRSGRLGSGRQGQLRLGSDERARAVSIPFSAGGGSHVLVVGATGSGKTVTQTVLAAHAVAQGMGAIVLDPKGDGDLRERLRQAAATARRAYLEWTPEGSLVYNPFARGDAGEIADKALGGERFTEPHYLRQAQRYLGHAVRALQAANVEVSLAAIVAHMEPSRLEELARELPEAQARATFSYLDSLSTRQQGELAGVRDRLAILSESEVGRWLDPQDGVPSLDLLSAVRSRAVVYFALHSDARPLLSEMLGAAIVQDVQTVVASLQGRPTPTLVAIDEFSAIAAERVVRLFARARSAGFSLLLGTQELSDLRLPGRERLLEQVLGNLSVLIAHRQVVPSSAEMIACVAGRRGVWRVTSHSDGRSTRTRVQEPVLDPQQVMRLGCGWAAVLVLGESGAARVTRVERSER